MKQWIQLRLCAQDETHKLKVVSLQHLLFVLLDLNTLRVKHAYCVVMSSVAYRCTAIDSHAPSQYAHIVAPVQTRSWPYRMTEKQTCHPRTMLSRFFFFFLYTHSTHTHTQTSHTSSVFSKTTPVVPHSLAFVVAIWKKSTRNPCITRKFWHAVNEHQTSIECTRQWLLKLCARRCPDEMFSGAQAAPTRK